MTLHLHLGDWQLADDCPYLEILTIVENRARDHRLRVLFPTGLNSDRGYADGHFAIASRPVLPGPGEGWCQPPSTDQPHHSWFAADNGRYGLPILSEGLPEHEASRPGWPHAGADLAARCRLTLPRRST